MRSSTFALVAAATVVSAGPRYLMYFDQWHKQSPPPKEVTAGVNYVVTAFAPAEAFNTGSAYTPFMPLEQVKALFDKGTKVCMAIGGWGDTLGFGIAAATEQSRKTYATNVAQAVTTLGYDCVDIDWEYPGGNGDDYKNVTNDKKVSEIETYPLLLQEIKTAIGAKEMSIAVAGKEGDMIAFSAEQMPKIAKIVDFVNVMSYDLMNRRDTVTNHHTSVKGCANTIDLYIKRGMPASKLNLGFAFYAKWFTTKDGETCDKPTGCPTAVLEYPNGTDAGLSGAWTFETESFAKSADFVNAMKNGKEDPEEGGQWYWDANKKQYWTWDTPQLIARKFKEIVVAKKLGGVFAWSLAQDSKDWSHFKAMQTGVKTLQGGGGGKKCAAA